jgi:hypothetical protein
VQALVAAPASALVDARLILAVGEQSVEVAAIAVAESPGHSTVRLTGDHRLPAGTYTGRLAAGEQTWDVSIDVHAKPRVRLYPRRLELASGDAITFDVLNVGNVAVDVAAGYAVPLERSGVLRRAIIAGVQSERGGVDRWGAAADEVADSQAGVARLAIAEGAGRLEPGAATHLVGRLTLPAGVEAGVTYAGSVRIAGSAVAVRVTPDDVAPKPASTTPRSRRKKE